MFWLKYKGKSNSIIYHYIWGSVLIGTRVCFQGKRNDQGTEMNYLRGVITHRTDE